ncbi:MAG TPA: MAPEG family protein [Xanthobacteraceae bacterium]|nr:MAPEG family protein [Xanthobacteraceae bacterium]
MPIQVALMPLFFQVLLVFGLMIWMAMARQRALQRGDVHSRDIALRQPAWPLKAMQVANCFANQFELPVLFYVVTILALITRQFDFLFLVLSWIFVLLRYVHAFIHTTSNRVSRRGLVYILGAIVLFALWIEFALRLYLF